MRSQIFNMSHMGGNIPELRNSAPGHDGCHGARQPPINRVAAKADTLIMFMYSAKKYHANLMDEYSVINPATSSPSASGRSNGKRLVSPTIEMRYRTKAGNNGQIHHRS